MKNIPSLRRHVLIFPLAMGLALPLAGYADYRSEFSLSGVHSNNGSDTTRDDGGQVISKIDLGSEDSYALDATVYLTDVSTEGVPLKEAAFLSKASSVSASYVDVELETDSGDIDSDGWALSTRQFIGGNYFLGASYGQVEVENIDSDAYGIEAGLYVNDNTSIALEISQLDIDDVEEEFETYTLRIHTVAETYEGSKVSGDVYAGTTETAFASTVIQLGGELDFFFNDRFSVGGGVDLQFPNGDQDDANTYSIRSDYFITENLAVGASFSLTVFQEETGESNADRSVDNTEIFALTLTGRI